MEAEDPVHTRARRPGPDVSLENRLPVCSSSRPGELCDPFAEPCVRRVAMDAVVPEHHDREAFHRQRGWHDAQSSCIRPQQSLGSEGYQVGARGGVRWIALEDPGDRDQYALAAWPGIEAVPVAVDQGGIDLGALSAADVRAVLLTPAHQYPTGVLLAPERRQALVAWAAERDATIIEDDYDAEFRYDRRPFEGCRVSRRTGWWR